MTGIENTKKTGQAVSPENTEEIDKKIMGWRAKLTTAEIDHLRANGIKTDSDLIRQFSFMESVGERHFQCHECLRIKRKIMGAE